MAPSKPFCNLTSFYFSISQSDYYRNYLDEIWGCVKHVGMSYEMTMSLPIQERRAFIRKHNLETDAINREIERSTGNGNSTHLEGEGINRFAERSQKDPFMGG